MQGTVFRKLHNFYYTRINEVLKLPMFLVMIAFNDFNDFKFNDNCFVG